MKRKNALKGGVKLPEGATWQEQLSPQSLEDLVCETTLGGCGHTFGMHKNYSVQAGGGAYCIVCRKYTSDAVAYAQSLKKSASYTDAQRDSELARVAGIINARRARECHAFVNGLVRHMDPTKLLNAPIKYTDGTAINARARTKATKAERDTHLRTIREQGK